MARRFDSGWRDSRLPLVHAGWDVPVPAAGISLAMVEYDHGEALAVINYIRRDSGATPRGKDVARAYRALGSLSRRDGRELPFLTCLYDPRNWAMKLLPHNESAEELLGTRGWLAVTEAHFVRLLYRLRGRLAPFLAPYGVELSTAPWIWEASTLRATGWLGQDISTRRRWYEPEGRGVTFNMRNPCFDIDLAVIGFASGTVTLLVDYKLEGADVDPSHPTFRALSGIVTGGAGHSLPIPAMITRYDPSGDHGWKFQVMCLNQSAERLLYAVMTRTHAVPPTWQPVGWTYVDEARWVRVLEEAQRS